MITAELLRSTFPAMTEDDASRIELLISVEATDEALELFDKVVENYGIETLRDNDFTKFYGGIGALYSNNGDSYRATLIFDTRTNEWHLMGWADYAESLPDRYGE